MGKATPTCRSKSRRNTEAGFGHHANIELMIVVAIIGIIAAIAIPNFLAAREKNLANGPIACLQNMVKIAEGSDVADFECPVSEKSYTVRRSGGQDILNCPDPEQHLSYGPHFIREGGRWRFTAEIPGPAVPPGQSMEFAAWTNVYSVENKAEQILVRGRRQGIVRFVGAPLLLLLGIFFAFCLVIMLIFSVLELWDELTAQRNGISGIFAATIVGIVFFSSWASITYLMVYGGANALFSQSSEITISKSDGTVHLWSFTLGERSDTRTIENTKLFYPLSGRLLVIYEDGELLQHRFLRIGGTKVAEAVAGMLLASEPF